MKHKISSVLAVIMLFATAHLFAQSPPAKQESPKDQLVKMLSDFQPRLNELNKMAKAKAAEMPGLNKATEKLDDMVSDFKVNLDKLDVTARDMQDQYISRLHDDWSAIEAEYKKINEQLHQGADDRNKSGDDQQPPK